MNYWLLRNDQRFGPYLIEDLRRMVAERNAFEFDWVWQEDTPSWVRLIETAEWRKAQPPHPRPRGVRIKQAKPAIAKLVDTVKDYFVPDRAQVTKAKELEKLANNLWAESVNLVSNAYQTHLRGDSEEALDIFVAAAKMQIEANKLSNDAIKIYNELEASTEY
jgi:hypothetical protein